MSGIRIDAITIGRRHRKDFGDMEGLARSMDELGLLQPIGVRPDMELIWGERRLRAAQLLGWIYIPARVVDLKQIVLGEYAENAFQKQFTPSELVAIAAEIEPIEREQAKARAACGHNQHTQPSEKFSKGSAGRALDKVAKVGGMSRPTLVKAREIVAAAKAHPERFGKLLADMDRTGRVDGPHNRLKVMQQAGKIRAEPPPYPGRGPYRVIVADVPWPYEVRQEDPSHRATHPYPQMSIAQICAAGPQVRAIAHDHCILWFWTTNHHMRLAYQVLDAWGFQEKTILTWVKDRMGRGDWLRGQTEHCIVAVRGKPIVELTNQTTVLHGPLRANSQKPVQFYDLVESLCPAPRYADLFSRYRHNEKWDRHGDQAPHYDAINDINKSVAEGFAAIKQRKAAGGPGWKGHDAPSLAPGDPGEMPAFLRRDGGGDE